MPSKMENEEDKKEFEYSTDCKIPLQDISGQPINSSGNENNSSDDQVLSSNIKNRDIDEIKLTTYHVPIALPDGKFVHQKKDLEYTESNINILKKTV